MEKRALITGVTGQDGSYLAEYLLALGYQVCGMYRRCSVNTHERLKNVIGNSHFTLRFGDLKDSSSLYSLIASFEPHEVYNLAAQSDVGASFELPEETGEVTGLGVMRLLEAIRAVNTDIKFYQASSSELFGKVQETPQKETTPFYPRSPYGVAKLYAYWITKNYREAYKMFACNGILFNHESPRRGENFVTQKIVKQMVAYWRRERNLPVELGNLNAKRDWGFAGDYVKAMHAMLQVEYPDDYVIATGKTFMVREFVEAVGLQLGLNILWKGEGLQEVGYTQYGDIIVTVNPRYYRPSEVDILVGDATKAKQLLNWQPEVDLYGLVELMVKNELNEEDQSPVNALGRHSL